jgi:hypothetical protein
VLGCSTLESTIGKKSSSLDFQKFWSPARKFQCRHTQAKRLMLAISTRYMTRRQSSGGSADGHSISIACSFTTRACSVYLFDHSSTSFLKNGPFQFEFHAQITCSSVGKCAQFKGVSCFSAVARPWQTSCRQFPFHSWWAKQLNWRSSVDSSWKVFSGLLLLVWYAVHSFTSFHTGGQHLLHLVRQNCWKILEMSKTKALSGPVCSASLNFWWRTIMTDR